MPSNDLLDNELNVYQVWKIICHNRKQVIFIPFLLTMIIAILIALLEPAWEGESVIEIGRVGKIIRATSPNSNDKEVQEERNTLIETPELTITRLLHPSFLKELSKDSKLPEKISAKDLASARILASKVKDTSLIKLEVHADSQEAVIVVSNLVLDHLNSIQKERINYTENLLKKRISLMDSNIDEVNLDLKMFGGKYAKSESITADFYLKNLATDRKYFQTEKAFLEEQLSPNYTFPTRFFSKTYVTHSRFNLSKIIMLSMVFAALVFVTSIAVIVRHTLTTEPTQS